MDVYVFIKSERNSTFTAFYFCFYKREIRNCLLTKKQIYLICENLTGLKNMEVLMRSRRRIGTHCILFSTRTVKRKQNYAFFMHIYGIAFEQSLSRKIVELTRQSNN